MDNISSQIGALELGDHMESPGDGVLETAFGGPPPNTGQTMICRTMFPGQCISDGALESFGAAIGTPATAVSTGCSTFYCPTRLCFQ
jgi:hypothetical protein